MNTNKNDLLILLPLIFLLALGLIMVTSSSIYIADDMKSDPFYFAERQFIFMAIGLMALLFFLVIPSEFLYKSDWIFLLISILFLIALFIRLSISFLSKFNEENFSAIIILSLFIFLMFFTIFSINSL